MAAIFLGAIVSGEEIPNIVTTNFVEQTKVVLKPMKKRVHD